MVEEGLWILPPWVDSKAEKIPPLGDQPVSSELPPPVTPPPSSSSPASLLPHLEIRVEPGFAFGTGEHPTTRLCLRWLRRHVTAGSTVLDYGTGSGVLAIAALKVRDQRGEGRSMENRRGEGGMQESERTGRGLRDWRGRG